MLDVHKVNRRLEAISSFMSKTKQGNAYPDIYIISNVDPYWNRRNSTPNQRITPKKVAGVGELRSYSALHSRLTARFQNTRSFISIFSK